MYRLLIHLALLLFFICYLIWVLRFTGKQSWDEPFWIPKQFGVGIGINPRNKLGYWTNLVITVILMMLLIGLLLSDLY